MRGTVVVLGSTITGLAVGRLARSSGFRAIVVDRTRGIAMKSRRLSAIHLGPVSDTVALTAIEGLANSPSTPTLIATGDDWVRFVRVHRAQLAHRFQIVQPDNDVVDILLNKHRFAHWCAAHRLPHPRLIADAELAELSRLPLPLLLRPAQTLHQSSHLGLPKAQHVETRDELVMWLDRFRDAGVPVAVSESLLNQDLTQLSVPFCRCRGTTVAFVARKVRPHPNRCSVGTFVETTTDRDAMQLALTALEKLQYEGIGEVEILRVDTTGRHYLIEVNPRPWLQFSMASRVGHNFLRPWLKAGETVTANPEPTRHATWLDSIGDLYSAFSRTDGLISSGELSVLGYFRSLLAANCHARWDIRDPMPAIRAYLTFVRSHVHKPTVG